MAVPLWQATSPWASGSAPAQSSARRQDASGCSDPRLSALVGSGHWAALGARGGPGPCPTGQWECPAPRSAASLLGREGFACPSVLLGARSPRCGVTLAVGLLYRVLAASWAPRASCLLRAVFSSVPCLGYLTSFEAGVRLRLPWKHTPWFADLPCWGLCSSPGCIWILFLGTPPPARNKGSNGWLWAWVWFITTCRVCVVPLGDMTVSVPESVLLGTLGPGETPRGTLSSVSVTVALSFLEYHTGGIPGYTVFCV